MPPVQTQAPASTPGAPAPQPAPDGSAARRGRAGASAVIGLLVGALALRLWGIKQGLPYAYNIDENAHFVPRAIGFFGHTINPFYFVNPPAYIYLLHGIYALWYGSGDAVGRAFATNPTEVWVIARATAALLGTLAVWLVYLAGCRLLDRRAGLLAGALLAVAFLPVFYSHLALNDGPALAPVALSLLGTANALRLGRARDYALAGVGAGLAAAVKYTAGIMVVPALCVALWHWHEAHGRALWASGLRNLRARRLPRVRPRAALQALWRNRALRMAVVVLAATFVAFAVASPYSLLSPSDFRDGIMRQAATTGNQDKLGATESSGYRYYLWTLTWGLGFVPSIALVVGMVGLAWRRRAVWLTLVPTLVVFFVFMAKQQRFYGRWLMPVFPVACVVAAFGVLWVVDRLAARRPRLRPALVAVGAVALCGQGLLYSVHSDLVLSRADTRAQLRAWLVARVPAGALVSVEPIVPDSWSRQIGPGPPTSGAYRWNQLDVYNVPDSPILVAADLASERVGGSVFGLRGEDPAQDGLRQALDRLALETFPRQTPGALLPSPKRPGTGVVGGEGYTRILSPRLIDVYEARGVCYVVTGSIQSERALANPRRVPAAVDYYRALARRGSVVFRASPYGRGAGPVRFNFDWSFDYYPLAYARPGPDVIVYRLHGGVCAR